MKFTLTSTLLLAACTLATLLSTTEAGKGEVCTTKCQVKLSVAVEKCIKNFPVTDSDGRLECNKPLVAALRQCENRCREAAIKCEDKCFLKANAAWEPCVTQYKDPKDPKRIQCLKDAEETRHNMVAIGLNSVNAQGDPVCIKKCDEAFSESVGTCILAHPKKPKHPERKECVADVYNTWVNCLENCYD
ncbi:hypothetical protein BGZ72_000188 [Mortierella alpina]|nr:hypothetical protein BGZ72_000188 [Mortierella alpina]